MNFASFRPGFLRAARLPMIAFACSGLVSCQSRDYNNSGVRSTAGDQLSASPNATSPIQGGWNPGELKFSTYDYPSNQPLKVRITVQKPVGAAPVGDVLYIHGFADRPDNHKPLFDELNRSGLRVVGFDLPGHGENKGDGNHLDKWNFDELRELVFFVDKDTREAPSRPFFVVAWSLGGLIAARQFQELHHLPTRHAEALVLITPSVSVKTFVGEEGVVTTRTLTSNPSPPHLGPIHPRSPLLSPIFAAHLLGSTKTVWEKGIFKDIPVLTLAAGNTRDVYTNSNETIRWAKEQKEKFGVNMTTFQCDTSFHEMDNEPDPVGEWTRKAITSFIVGRGKFPIQENPACLSAIPK